MNRTYAQLDATERVRAIDATYLTILKARHDPPLPELSTPTQTWVDRVKSMMADPDVSEKSQDEMEAAFRRYVAGLDRDEYEAVVRHVTPWCWSLEKMPPGCTTVLEFYDQVIAPRNAALGLGSS
jgi:hypothetical protein